MSKKTISSLETTFTRFRTPTRRSARTISKLNKARQRWQRRRDKQRFSLSLQTDFDSKDFVSEGMDLLNQAILEANNRVDYYEQDDYYDDYSDYYHDYDDTDYPDTYDDYEDTRISYERDVINRLQKENERLREQILQLTKSPTA